MANIPPVLIVGAGPSGLMMACQLALRNIPFRIIDKTADHTTQSRALVVQARTLEIFAQMGIAQKALEQGEKCNAANFLLNGQQALHIPLQQIDQNLTKFPYVLMLEQYKTEILLCNFLKERGFEVERNVELVNLYPELHQVTAVLKHQKSGEETAVFSYVIGADGAHSAVRELLKIPFEGKTYQVSLYVIDCKVKAKLAPNEMYLSFSEQTALAGFFPISNGRYRVIGSVDDAVLAKGQVTFEELTANFAQKTHLDATLSEPNWYSVYHSHHRYAAKFRVDRCFLIGDAAHIHSPVGGQGMNTGLQDAYNLAWKLALVIKESAHDALLNTYSEERMQVAKELVHSTDKVFYLATNESTLARIFKFHLLPIICKLVQPWIKKGGAIPRLLFLKVSELGINYHHDSLAKNASHGVFSHDAPKPGYRAPAILQDKLRDTNWHLFIFTKQNDESAVAQIVEVIKDFDFITTQVIPLSENAPLYQAMGIENDGVYLIRPDMYIAYRSTSFEVAALREYLKRVTS